MLDLAKGRYRARIAADGADLEAAQRLRTLAFRGPMPSGWTAMISMMPAPMF